MENKKVKIWIVIILIMVLVEIIIFQIFLSYFINNKPNIQLPQGVSHDFGLVMEGEKVEYSFIIKNIGKEILEILDVKTGCGCTEAKVNKTEVNPGDKCEVSITYIARRVKDREVIESYIKTSDPENPLIVFTLTGNIKYRVFWYPESVSYYEKTGGDYPVKEIKFLNQLESKDPLELEVVSKTSEYVNIQFVQYKEEMIAKISLSPDCPKGTYIENVSLKYSKEDGDKPINIPIYIILH